MDKIHQSKLSTSLTILRLFIGWHFFYEGIVKVYNPSWTARGYLVSSEGFLRDFYLWLASDSLISIVDLSNIAILLFVGATLLLGVWEKPGALLGAVLLAMYYLAHPAFPWINQGPTEGNYWLINKNLIEAMALVVLYHFPTGEIFGLDRLFQKKPQTS